jgi:hypothetical protein
VNFGLATNKRPPWMGEGRESNSPLTLLAEILEAELEDHAASLTIRLHRNRLTIAYHQVVVLQWKLVGRDLVCTPTGWHRKIYTALGPAQARSITIRLVFEFNPAVSGSLRKRLRCRAWKVLLDERAVAADAKAHKSQPPSPTSVDPPIPGEMAAVRKSAVLCQEPTQVPQIKSPSFDARE